MEMVDGRADTQAYNYLMSETFTKSSNLIEQLVDLLPNAKVTLSAETAHVGEYKLTRPQSIEVVRKQGRVSKRVQECMTQRRCIVGLGVPTYCTHVRPQNVVATDMMHSFHNLFDMFMDILFSTRLSNREVSQDAEWEQLNVDAKNRLLNTVLNEGKRGMGLLKEGEKVNFFGVDENVRKLARKRSEAVKKFPSSLNDWVRGLVRGEKVRPIRAEEKIIFSNAILPHLLCDSMDDSQVWSIVTILMLMGIFFNHDGTYAEAQKLHLLLHITTSIFEMGVNPGFCSMYLHSNFHLLRCFRCCGPLRFCDTLHCESQYCGLSEMATGGSNPVQTMASNVTYCNAAFLMSSGIRWSKVRMTSFTLCDDLSVREGVAGAYDSVLKRSSICLQSDRARLQRDACQMLSFTDLEFMSVHSFNQGTFVNQDISCGNGESVEEHGLENGGWITSDEDVEEFMEKQQIEKLRRGSCIQILDDFYWQSWYFGSLGKLPKDLTSSFEMGRFAAMRSASGSIHFFGIYKYIAICMSNGDIFMEALVYEIPIQDVNHLVSSPFAFRVDLDIVHRMNPHFTLISVNRLLIQDVFFMKLCDLEIGVGIPTVYVRQWQLYTNVCMTLSKACASRWREQTRNKSPMLRSN